MCVCIDADWPQPRLRIERTAGWPGPAHLASGAMTQVGARGATDSGRDSVNVLALNRQTSIGFLLRSTHNNQLTTTHPTHPLQLLHNVRLALAFAAQSDVAQPADVTFLLALLSCSPLTGLLPSAHLVSTILVCSGTQYVGLTCSFFRCRQGHRQAERRWTRARRRQGFRQG